MEIWLSSKPLRHLQHQRRRVLYTMWMLLLLFMISHATKRLIDWKITGYL